MRQPFGNLSGFIVLASVSVAALLTQSAAAKADLVELTPIGNPIWKPVDFHLFLAPIGFPGSIRFNETIQSLLPPPHHVLHPQLGVGPGTAHPPPYDAELAEGVRNLGYVDRNRFLVGENYYPNAVYLVWMNVPNPGTTGSSPDFASGPIIPNSIFPITVDRLLHFPSGPDSHAVDSVPPLNDPRLTPSFDVDGHSHFPYFIAQIRSPDVALGNYETVVTMRDSQGNGWVIRAPFEVAAIPEPGTITLLGFGALVLCGYVAWRGERGLRAFPPRARNS